MSAVADQRHTRPKAERSRSLRLEDDPGQINTPRPGNQICLALTGFLQRFKRDLTRVLPHSLPRGAPRAPGTPGTPGPPATIRTEPEHPHHEPSRPGPRPPDTDHSAGDDHRARGTDRTPDRLVVLLPRDRRPVPCLQIGIRGRQQAQRRPKLSSLGLRRIRRRPRLLSLGRRCACCRPRIPICRHGTGRRSRGRSTTRRSGVRSVPRARWSSPAEWSVSGGRGPGRDGSW